MQNRSRAVIILFLVLLAVLLVACANNGTSVQTSNNRSMFDHNSPVVQDENGNMVLNTNIEIRRRQYDGVTVNGVQYFDYTSCHNALTEAIRLGHLSAFQALWADTACDLLE